MSIELLRFFLIKTSQWVYNTLDILPNEYYNIDIETGKSLNLRDLLGEDYKQIVDETINKEIEERSKNPDNIYFSKSQGGFSGIEDEYQNFYINSNGKVVIVFKKYEIAPGYMGIQEFEIDRSIF